MKRLLLALSLTLAFASAEAQYIFIENFDVFPTTWTTTNQSEPTGPSLWRQGTGTQFSPGGFNGDATSFTLVNSASCVGSGTISNWLITPVIGLQDGDIIRFWSRVGGTFVQYPDRLEMRISTNGAATAMPVGATAVGDFTTLALTVNPNLTIAGYPLEWTLYSYEVTGLPTLSDSKIALRYYVTNGGTTGANSNLIGVDAFSIERTLGTKDFFAANYSVYPNPASTVLKVSSKSHAILEKIELSDLNGRVVKSINPTSVSESQVNIADLSNGIYLLKVKSDHGIGVSKIVKK